MSKIYPNALTILVVEDEPCDFGLIRALVRLAGLGRAGGEPVIWAKTLAEGLAEAGRRQPEIVLLDLALPDSMGVSTVQAMRAAFPDIPIVVLTGHDDSALVVAALEAGAQDYLVKGQFDVDALSRAVRNALVRGALETRLRLLNETLEQRVQEELAKNRDKDSMLMQQSRLAIMGEMMHNIAHQWRQPISALNLLLANIKDANDFHELDTAMIDESTKQGQELIHKMSSTIDDFRNFFKPNKEKQRFRACDGVDEAIKLISLSLKNSNIEIEQEKSCDPCEVMGYPNEFEQVVLNALSNAKDAIVGKKSPGKLHIKVEKGIDTATISIRDNGGGIPEEILPKVFDPYFTTKEKGTGIGLYMSKMIMEHMDGRLSIRNVEGGAEVLMTLPLAGSL